MRDEMNGSILNTSAFDSHRVGIASWNHQGDAASVLRRGAGITGSQSDAYLIANGQFSVWMLAVNLTNRLTLILTLPVNLSYKSFFRRHFMIVAELLKKQVKSFAADESGATAIEYGVIISILSLAIIGSANSVWVVIRDKFVFIGQTITNG
jgi:pilus assembly protein Flp/PilA